jgi:hypothetical protein
MSQNLLDFYNIKYKTVTQCASFTIEELCNDAIDLGLKNLLIIKQGCILYDFIDRLEDFIENHAKDAVLIGHILDRGDKWWQIHPQTLFINLEWWETAGRPAFGEKSNDDWDTIQVNRSSESLSGSNDDYNPISITGSTIPVKCQGAWEGHTLLHAALSSGEKVGIWNTEMRQQKENLYAEMNDHGDQIWALGKQLWTSQWFGVNTEDMGIWRKPYNTSAVFSTGGGLSPIINAYQNNLVNGGHLNITDLDPITLMIQSHIWDNWDGTNYSQFIREFVSTNSYMKNHISKYNQLEQNDAILDTIPEFVNWWKGNAATFNVNINRIELIDINRMKKQFNRELYRRKYGGGDGQHIFIDVSNAFNYEVNAILYSRKIRFGLEKDYVSFFKEQGDTFKHKGFTFHELIERDDKLNQEKFPWIQELFPWQK